MTAQSLQYMIGYIAGATAGFLIMINQPLWISMIPTILGALGSLLTYMQSKE